VSFESFDLDPRIMAGIARAGFITPTAIQSQTIPEALKGRDVMGLAQTGTGKTAAFVLPMLQRLMNGLMNGKRGKIRGLVITPTRELAEQTQSDIMALGGKTRLRSMTVYGGVSMAGQLQKLRSGVEIIVACPGRLLDHMGQGTVDLSSVEFLVLDEADRMLDMGFLPDVRRILRQIPRERQTLFFSATMPDDIRRLSGDIMRNPAVAQIDHSRPAKTLSHALYPVEPHLKTPLLITLLRSTRIRTQRVAEQLRKAGFSVASLQGGMPQGKRQAALNGFRNGTYRILVATDIAARGMDILGISHVINYDMPESPDAYTHRVGRTGRAERTGTAFTLVTQEDAPTVRAFERLMDVELVCRELEDFDYTAPAPARPYGIHHRPGTGKGLRHSKGMPNPRRASNNGGPRRQRQGATA
jgi:ATP-dependent RNA helicase RhlE